MAKFVNPAVLNQALNEIATANLMVAINGQPASYAAAQSGKLAETALSAGDFTQANGDVNGRKVTIAAKTGAAIIAAGTANHIALLDTAGSRLLYVTTCPAVTLPASGTVNFEAWKVEIGDPT
jgi:predicted aspartyl protease